MEEKGLEQTTWEVSPWGIGSRPLPGDGGEAEVREDQEKGDGQFQSIDGGATEDEPEKAEDTSHDEHHGLVCPLVEPSD